MTVDTTERFKSYVATGLQATLYAIPFQFYEVDVYVNAALQQEGIHYILIDGSGGGSTGSIQFILGSEPTAGASIALVGDQTIQQPTAYTDFDDAPSDVYERTVDQLTMMVKEMDEKLGRSLRGALFSPQLPALDFAGSPNSVVVTDQFGVPQLADANNLNLGSSFYQQGGTGSVVLDWLVWAKGVNVTPEQFGAKNDGTTDDGPAIQRAINYCRSLPNGGTVTMLPGTGYKIATAIDAFPSKRLCLDWMPGSLWLCALTGAATVMLKGSHPTVPGTRGLMLKLVSPNWDFHSSVTAGTVGAVFFEYLHASGLVVEGTGKALHYRDNTLVRLSATWNCDLGPWSLWGGSISKWRKVPDPALQFSVSSGSPNISATGGTPFDASDIGRTLLLQDNSLQAQLFTVQSVTNSTNIVATQNADVTFTNAGGCFDPVKATINSGSATLTFETSVLTASDVGRVVYVMDARTQTGNKCPLRATITAQGGTTATLDTAATVTATNVYVLFSPSVEIFSSFTAGEAINDIQWNNLHIEQTKGAGLVVSSDGSGGTGISFDTFKVHGWNSVFDSSATSFHMLLAVSDARLSGMIHGRSQNSHGRIIINGVRDEVSFDYITNEGVNRQPLVYTRNNHNAAKVVVNDVSVIDQNISQASMDALLLNSDALGKLYRNGVISHTANVRTNFRDYQDDRLTNIGDATADTDALSYQGAKKYLSYTFQSWVASSVTGTTNETVLATIAIPAGAIGANGSVEVEALFSQNNSGNSKTARIRFGASGAGTGGTLYDAAANTTNLAEKMHQRIGNRGAANSQVGNQILGDEGWGAGASGHQTSAINTANATEIALTGQLANAADSITLEGYIVTIHYKA